MNNSKFNFRKRSIDKKDNSIIKDESFKQKRPKTPKSKLNNEVDKIDRNNEEMKNDYMKSLPLLKKFSGNENRK